MRVLLIMPNFFDYPAIISDELKRMGYEVDFFDDRPSTNPWVKAIIRINKNLIGHYIQNYFDSMMESIKGKKYDIVFLISGQSLSFSEEMLKKLKASQPQAKWYLYQWDSLRNFPYIEQMQELFDKCYSFDREDCALNPKLKFLPLFYCRLYEDIGKQKKSDFKYDFCFVGTAHPKKYEFITRMSTQLKSVYPSQFIYFFFPSWIVYVYRKFKNPELKHAKINEFHFKPLHSEEMNEVYVESRCVLDSPQDGQLGLTIRVLEALGAKKKLITTNEDIVNYDFYRPENIYVYKDRFDKNSSFFTEPYKEIDDEIYEKYALRNWLKEIFA